MPNAASFYRSALKADPENTTLLERALVLSAAAGDIEEAVGFAKRLIVKQPNSHPARLVLAVEDLRVGKYSEAVARLDETSAGVLAELTDALVTAWAKFGEGEVGSALDDLGKLKGEDGSQSVQVPAWRLHRACCWANGGGVDAARESAGA